MHCIVIVEYPAHPGIFREGGGGGGGAGSSMDLTHLDQTLPYIKAGDPLGVEGASGPSPPPPPPPFPKRPCFHHDFI